MKTKSFKIYLITNKINQKIYVGKTIHTLHHRFKQHTYTAFSSNPRFKHIRLYEAMRKYGVENFEIKLLEIVKEESQLNEREIHWIQQLDSRNPEIGYNMLVGGEGGNTSESARRGVETRRKNGTLKPTEETKRKISESHKGKKFSEIHKQHLSDHHRLKRNHVLLYKDGHVEVSNKSTAQLAASVGVSSSVLRNYSIKGDSHKIPFYILDFERYDESFYHLFVQPGELCYWDPIKESLVTFESLVAYKKYNPSLYRGVIPHQCLTEEKQAQKNQYIKDRQGILQRALKG